MASNLRRLHLAGLRVVDFSAVFAGPICTRMLSDCGADVIKVEAPTGGDLVRGPKGMSRVFTHFNAGKRSAGINLNLPEGPALAKSLLKDADVMVENYRPGIMKRFGLDYASLKDEFPGLVYCSISGFGQSGPYVDRAAYAPIAHAASGFDHAHVAAQRDESGRPPVWSIMIADMLTGSYAHGAILTALMGRQATGLGDYIDVTMMESMMMLIPGQIQAAQLDTPGPAGVFHPARVKDGFVMICIVSGKNFRGLCDAISRPDMYPDERFQRSQRANNQVAFFEAIEAWTMQFTARECEERLNKAGVPCSLYNAPSELFNHPQVTARKSFTKFFDDTSSYLIQSAPFQFASGPTPPKSDAPVLGEHTRSVLGKHYDNAALDRLETKGVISMPLN